MKDFILGIHMDYLYEKVIGKIHGGYNKIKWGYSSTIYKMLTDFNSDQLEMQEMIKNEIFFMNLLII